MATIFNVVLTSSQEVPSNDTTPTGVLGVGTVHWDAQAETAAYHIVLAGVDFTPLLGGTGTETTDDDVTSMHVHSAPRGENGPVVFGQVNPANDADDLQITQNPNGTWTVSGVWETTDTPTQPGVESFAASLTDAAVGDDVPLYFNVHTPPFPAGEIRGQWVATAEADAFLA